MIKAVIFDLNGVFILSQKLSDRFSSELGIQSNDFLPALKETLKEARLPGSRDVYELWKPYLEKWGINFSRDQFLHFWFRAEGGNEEMIELGRNLKAKGIKLFILSNNFKERSEYYGRNFQFFKELFEKEYFSWKTGFVKPDAGAYELILSENNLRPQEVAYFDDSLENVSVAGKLGIKSYVFENAEDVKNKILS